MTDLGCDKLHDFVDGELGADEAEQFRAHLAVCARCATEMPRLLELIAACEQVAGSTTRCRAAPPPELQRPTRRAGIVARAGTVAAAIALAAAVALVALWSRPSEPAIAAFPNIPASRNVEVRFSHADAAAHRPYQVARGPLALDDMPLADMARLQHAGNWHGLAITASMHGDRDGALRYLNRAPPSRSVATDRAALEIVDGSEPAIERALAALDGVLAAEPGNLPARWNRALALARLDLPLAAARELDRVAAGGEPGWATEATQRAERLRASLEPRRAAWTAVEEAEARWIAGDGPRALGTGEPRGLLRLVFYDAVRAASSRARVEALLPLAHQLDTLYGGEVLSRYARTVAAADFRVRAPLAAAYRAIALGHTTPDDAAVDRLARQMRDAGATDLWIGLVVRTAATGRHIESFARAAQATADPWFVVMAAHEAARRTLAAGDRLGAEQQLLRAEGLAARAGLAYRRLRIELDLSKLYRGLRRFPEAEQRARDALGDARAAGEWDIEQLLLSELAEVTRLRYRFGAARASLEEVLERDPASCLTQRHVGQALANLAMLALDPVTARQQLAATPRCGEPLQILPAMTWADVYRFGGQPADATWLRNQLAQLRAAAPADAGQRALADHVEGRLVIELDRPAGQALLRQAIARVADQTDDASTKARAYSFSILALDAGRAGEHDRVLALLAEERGRTAPPRCVVGVAVEDERTVVAVRGADGLTAGEYTGARTSPRIDAQALIPMALVRRLEGCAEVSVLARPPLVGAARLLPPEVAWSYRLSREAPHAAGGAAASPPSGPHVVITDAEPPAHLGLPRLLAYAGGGADEVVLRGEAATPANVRRAIRDASMIEFHTHGFVDRGLSDASYLALTPDTDGRYALTAADVEATRLRGAPLVILAACGAALDAPFLDDSVGLPLAFLRAGARAVLASPAAVDDASAAAFVRGVRARVARGASLATAVRDERMARGTAALDWSADVIVYQ